MLRQRSHMIFGVPYGHWVQELAVVYMWIVLTLQCIVIGILFWLLSRESRAKQQQLIVYLKLLDSLVPSLPEKLAQQVSNFICMMPLRRQEMLKRALLSLSWSPSLDVKGIWQLCQDSSLTSTTAQKNATVLERYRNSME